MLSVLLQNDVHILKEGDKVGASDATLLNMLNISPFSYGLLVQMVYDSGTIFEPAILDIKPEDLRVKFTEVLSFFLFSNCSESVLWEFTTYEKLTLQRYSLQAVQEPGNVEITCNVIETDRTLSL